MHSEALPTIQTPSPQDEWKQELLHSYTSVSDLLRNHLVSDSEAQKLENIGEKFRVRITPYYAKIMSKSPECPIRKQAIPHLGEEDPQLPEWASQLSQEIYGRPTPWHHDAIGDIRNLAAPRLTHRYENRAILHLSSLCAVYCRFCFRKSHLNDDERTLYEGTLDPALRYLKGAEKIHELILTGGDPLSVTDAALKSLFERINQIPHIRTVRIHSRMTVTLPSRFTSSLLEILGQNWNFHINLVSHFNHPNELTLEAKLGLRRLNRIGITLLNQSVLLRGINNSVECLHDLFQTLYETGVIPYYLHHPDWTPGTFDFRLGIEEGQKLMTQLRGLLSGPALPQYILDIPQGYGKISLLDANVKKLKSFPMARPLSQRNHTSHIDHLQGAVYEIITPATRAGGRNTHLYLDLFPGHKELLT